MPTYPWSNEKVHIPAEEVVNAAGLPLKHRVRLFDQVWARFYDKGRVVDGQFYKGPCRDALWVWVIYGKYVVPCDEITQERRDFLNDLEMEIFVK